MNIWLLHPFAGGPAGLGRHWRPYWLADAWQRMGHRPLVVTGKFHHLHQKPQTGGFKPIDDVDFWFLDTPHYKSSLGRLWNNLSFGLLFELNAERISKQFGRPDLIIASSPHLFFVSAAHRVARRLGINFWVEIRDLWPESIVALGLVSAGHPLVKFIGWKERQAYSVADRVICLLANAEAYMKSRGLPDGRFQWVPNGVSSQEIQRALDSEIITHPLIERITQIKQHDGARVVLYAGAMGPPNAIEVIIDAAAALATTKPEIRFVLIGSGISRDQLKQRAAKLQNVEFYDEVERPIIHAMLRASDCAVVSFHDNSLYSYGISPNKLFDYCLFAPRTVIACKQQALTGLEELATSRCEPGDSAALARSLLAVMEGPTRSLAERIAATQRFSYSELAARYFS